MLLSSAAYSEMRFGVSGALTYIEASGTETEGGEKNSTTVDSIAIIPSIFVEYDAGNNLSVGLDYIPLDADVSNKTKSRTDTETSVTDTVAEVQTSRTQKAQAELSDHITLYANYDMGSYYLKAGVAQVTIETSESLDTGSKYGSADVYGGVFGVGRQDGNTRFELVYTNYEEVSLSSTVARTGVTTNNKIDADLDTLSLKYSYVF
tara:strand:- start:526 stop:1143 length:618 start_codon:yes stop_codon:yes gene_type:complete